MDPHPRPAQLLDVAVTPDPGARSASERTRRVLARMISTTAVVEGQRAQPPHASKGGSAAGPPVPVPHRPDAPGPVRLPSQGRRIDGDPFAVDDDAAAQVPSCAKRCASRVTRLPERKTRLFLTSNRPPR